MKVHAMNVTVHDSDMNLSYKFNVGHFNNEDMHVTHMKVHVENSEVHVKPIEVHAMNAKAHPIP
jgi:hypothetical protein